MYLDGEQLLSTDTTMTSTSEPLYIGTDGFNFYQGLLDEFAFYQRTLTSQEIGQLYQKTVEIQNPRLWDPQEFAQIDIYKPLESGSHIITFSTQSGIQQTATVEVS